MKRAGHIGACALAGLLLAAVPAQATTYPSGFEEQTLVEGLTRPVAVTWSPDGQTIFVAEKDGRLKVAPAAGGPHQGRTIYDIQSRVGSGGDRGLMGVAVHPNFAVNGLVYLTYTYDLKPGGVEDTTDPMVAQLLELTLNPATLAPQSERVLLGTHTSSPCPADVTENCIPSDEDSHTIGEVRVDPNDGTLWVATGDGASYNFADPLALRSLDQDSLAGKILHLDPEGNGITEHPFCPDTAATTENCARVWGKGFRNPFRFVFNPDGGLIVGDVGWGSSEELNLITAGGKSFGWPCYEGFDEAGGYRQMAACQDEYESGTELPPYIIIEHERDHAIVAGPKYKGTIYPTEYRDSIFYGDYAAGKLRRVKHVNGSPQVTLVSDDWLGVDLELTPSGDLAYVHPGNTFGAGEGTIRQIVYSPGNASPVAVASASPDTGAAPLTVNFSSAGSSDPDGEQITYSWDFQNDGTVDSNLQSPSFTYDTPGRYTARLTVRDTRGKTGTDTVLVDVGTRPMPAIANAPPQYELGQTITLDGSATDAEDGDLPESALRWSVTLMHGGHQHPGADQVATDSFQLTDDRSHDSDSRYVVTLTATDSSGLSASTSVSLHPEATTVRIESVPTGAPVGWSDRSAFAPFQAQTAVGYFTSVSADEFFTLAGKRYEFASWSDGKARLHNITVPNGGLTLTARYRLLGGTPSPPPAGGSPSPPGDTGTQPDEQEDEVGPALRFSAAKGLSARRGRLRGRVEDPAGVDYVGVALGRRKGSRCRWWSKRKGGLTRRKRACGKPRWIKAIVRQRAGGGFRWKASLGGEIPDGRYRLRLRALDELGNKTIVRRGLRLR